MEIDAKPSEACQPQGTIRVADLSIGFRGVRRQRSKDRVLNFVPFQRRLFKTQYRAGNSNRGGLADDQEEIAADLLHKNRQPVPEPLR